MKFKNIMVAALATVVLLSTSFTTDLTAHASVTVESLNKSVEDSEKQVDTLEKKKEQAKIESAEKKKAVEKLIIEVDLMEESKLEIEKDIKFNNLEIKSVESEIEKIQEEIELLEKDIEYRKEIVGKRLAAVQLNGEFTYLDVMFASENIIDFFAKSQSVMTILDADKEIVENLKSDVIEVQEKLAEVEDLKSRLEEVKEENLAKKASLEKKIKSIEIKKDQMNEELKSLNTSMEKLEEEQSKLIQKINKEIGMKENMEEELSKGKFEWPTDGGYISSGLGHRTHPKTGVEGVLHKGIDIARTDRSKSPPIYSVQDGVVVKAGPMGGLGNAVKIKHADGLETVYGHMVSLSVESGQKVKRGQKLGIMGTTGKSTGIHLHLEVYKDGKLQNPLQYFDEDQE